MPCPLFFKGVYIMLVQDLNSYYDLDTHTAYPTIQYIANQTGENMITLTGNELKAKAKIRQITDEIKQSLFNLKIRETFNVMEYLIATNRNYRLEWNKAIANIIYAEYNMTETRQEAIERVLKGSNLLSIERFTYIKYDYRKGY